MLDGLARHLFERDTNVGNLRGSGPPSLNWLFLIECVVVVILVLFYFFYISRLLGIIVSWILRLALWRSTNSYFEIGAVKVSILGGSIQFNDFRYISRNQSLRIVRGHIVWKYWLRHVRSEENKLSEARKPCRIQISLTGAEWFLYNRTPSYDAILDQLGVCDPFPTNQRDDVKRRSSTTSTEKSRDAVAGVERSQSALLDGEKGFGGHVDAEDRLDCGRSRTDWLLEALPIEVECEKGAVILGNPSTPCILIAGFDTVVGTYSAVKARSELDPYKQVYHFNFRGNKVIWRTNPDYVDSMAECGQARLDELADRLSERTLLDLMRYPSEHLSFSAFSNLFRRKPFSTERSSKKKQGKADRRSSVEKQDPSGWTGLPRYQPAADPTAPLLSDTTRSSLHPAEYAKVTTLLVTREIDMTYYVDVAGLVPSERAHKNRVAGLETHDVGNGDLSPEWGVDLVIRGGAVTYGPWADRQRAKLQQAFIPATFLNGLETPRLRPGDQRLHTALNVFIEFSEGATVRVPTREPSKDWRYDDLDSTQDSVVRPYGWLDVSIGPNSTMTYVLPMVATVAGYDTLLELHLDEVGMSSSVNYAPFLQAPACRIHCGLPSPLVWDAKRVWTVTTRISKPDISLLRDHVTLLADIAKDWTSGPPGDYDHFVPFLYELNVEVVDYVVQLYLNDHNIINNPTTPEDNALLSLSGPTLMARVSIPSEGYRAECTQMHFGIDMTDVVLSMALPDWNTHRAFMTERTRTFASAPQLDIAGSYRFYAQAGADNVEKLDLQITSRDVVFKAIGWVIRYLLNLKENYFGGFTHFVTLEEYRHRHERNLQGDPLELKYRPGKTDAFDVTVAYELDGGLLLLPQEIYDCQSALVLALPHLQVDLRNHDYFMEMALNVGPLRLFEVADSSTLEYSHLTRYYEAVGDNVHVDGIEITANRLFGPQPRTATYMCIWSFNVGRTVGSVTPAFLQALSRAAGCAGITFADSDNSLPPDFAIRPDPDATFLSVTTDSFDLAIRGEMSACQLTLPEGVDLRFDDLASAPFLKHLSLDLPLAHARILAPLHEPCGPWVEVASLHADLSLAMGFSTSGWEARAREQLSFIAMQDPLTRRCRFVYGDGQEGGAHRVGSLYLPPLESPFTSQQPSAARVLEKEPLGCPAAPALFDMSSDNDDRELDVEMPDETAQDARHLAYAAILPLCDQSHHITLRDQATFRTRSKSPRRQGPRNAASARPGAKARIRDFGPAEFISVPEKRTCIDLRSYGGLRMTLSPLVCEAVDGLIKGLDIDIRPDHVLDGLYRAYLGERPRADEVGTDAFELKLRIPSIAITAIQDVLHLETSSAHADDERSRQNAKGPGPESPMFGIIRLDIVDAGVSYRDLTVSDTSAVTPSSRRVVERVLAGHADQSQLRVLRSSSPSVAVPDRAIGTPGLGRDSLVLHFKRCEVRVDYTLDRALLGLVGGSATLNFDGEAAGLLIGSLWSWRKLSYVVDTLSARTNQSALLTGRLLAELAAEGERVGALAVPVFLNRISYLAGASSTTRLDDIWKLLHILRQAHRQSRLPTEQLAPGKACSPAEDRDRFLRAISAHATWDLDVADIQTSRFIRDIFGSNGVHADPVVLPPSAPLWVHPFALDWTTATFEASFWHEGRQANRLTFGPTDALLGSSGVLPGADELNIRARLTLHSIGAQVDRDLLGLIRHIAGVRRTFEHRIRRFQAALGSAKGQPPPSSSPSLTNLPWATLPPINLSASIAILSTGMKADTGEVAAEVAGSAIITSVFLHIRPRLEKDGLFTGHSWTVASTFAAESASLAVAEGSCTSDVLLSANVVSSLHCLWLAGTRAADGKLAVASTGLNLSVGGVKLRVPRDAVRSYQFIDNLRATTLPTYDSLLSELRVDTVGIAEETKAAVGQNAGALEAWAGSTLSVQFACQNLVVTIQAIATLETSYCLERFSAFADTAIAETRPLVLDITHGGMHFGRQSVRFVPRLPEAARESTTDIPAETVFDLPIIRAVGRFSQRPMRHLKILVTIDPVAITLTAAVLDSILAVQRHFGHDIDELLSTVRARRISAGPLSPMASLPSTTSSPVTKLSFSVQIAFRGLKLGVQGPQAIQWVGVDLLEGHLSSMAVCPRLHCRAFLQDLALSLEQRTEHGDARVIEPDRRRRHRLAFFRLDLDADNVPPRLDPPSASDRVVSSTPSVTIRVPRLEAVLQPASIEALADLIEHFVVEIRLRRKSRQAELESLRTRVVSTLDNEAQGPKATSYLTSCLFSVQASRLGIAIPLSDEGITGAVATRRKRARAAQARPAFLLTLPSLSFSAQRGSDCDARIAKFSIQFVPDFDQGRIEHFDGDWHRSRNKIVLPDAQCTIRIANTGLTTVQSKVSGLEVDVDADVVSYVYALSDVYRLSHERFAKYADELPGNPADEVPSNQAFDASRHSRSEPRRIHADFTFASGVIRAHGEESVTTRLDTNTASGRPRHQRRGHSATDFAGLRRHPEHAGRDTSPDVFHLPALSAWAHVEDDAEDFAATNQKAHVDLVIHKSSNILYPSLLPFITNVFHQVKKRQTVSDASVPSTPAVRKESGSDVIATQSVPAYRGLPNLRLSVNLRIDESKLEISCMPAAEVVGQISWDSGGFLFTLVPRSGDVTLTATVDGVSATLRHLFSPEDCIRAETRGLAVAASYARPVDSNSGRILSVLVRVPDTSVDVNARHLQDWLCLKAIWIDQLDFGDSVAVARTNDREGKPASPDSSSAPVSSRTVTLVRLESGRCALSCDLGPAIGKWSITADDFATRLRLHPSSTRDAVISFGKVRVAGQGRAGGVLSISGFKFSTRLRDGQCMGGDKLSTSDLLHIEIALGKIDAAIEHDFHRILVFASDPLRVSVGDDWSRAREADPKLRLNFKVRAGSLQLISTTATVPILLGISRRVNALLDEKAATAAASLSAAGFKARESSSVKAATAVSNVASIFGGEQGTHVSARTSPVRIVNQLAIEIDSLRLAVFADHWNDGEVYRADAGASIRAELLRGSDTNQVIQRELRLHLGFFSIRKVNHRKVSPSQESDFDVYLWYEYLRTGSERNIFKIGTTDVAMDSEQVVGSNRLKHRFSMQFGGHVDVALNYALFRNLVTLSTQYQLQLDRVMGPAPESANSFKQSVREGGTPLIAPSATLPAADETKTPIMRPDLPSPEGEVIRMKPLTAIQASKAERRALEFEAIEMEVHQPQLQVLGDATPPLEWLGLQRDRFPAFVHTGVTSPLEELLIVLSSTYSSQLARSKFSEARPEHTPSEQTLSETKPS